MKLIKPKYYNLKNILARNAQYNVIIGERSNGKTYAVLEYAIRQYLKLGSQLAIIRRWQDDFTGKRGMTMFNGIVANGLISRLSNNKYTDIYYYGSRWYLCTYDDKGKRINDDKPLAYGFAITSMEHDKSTSYPDIKTILFDEFLTRTSYLPDEFVLYMNTLSTIIRERNDVRIFMLGNTVNKYCPYFKEMGLTHIKDMKPGDIDVYKYGSSALTVAVEYTAANKHGKESDVYFAFDNPKLSMITGGSWEIDIYPHCPCKYTQTDILYIYFIVWEGAVLQCEIIQSEDMIFTFIHPKTTPIKDTNRNIVYTPEFSPLPHYRRNITKPTTQAEQKIIYFYKADKVFYADNETGEIVRNYLLWCNKH